MKWGERMKPILWAKDLQKRYVIHSKGKGPLGALRRQTRVVEALKGVSFSLESGEWAISDRMARANPQQSRSCPGF